MKHARKYLAGVLSIIIAVAAFPTTTHATGIDGTDKSNNVTVDGINYSISQTNQTVQVTARQKGKIIDSCTAYLDQGYMLYKNKRTTKTSSAISSVSWLDDLIKESNPSTGSRMAAPAYSAWTKDGKYVFKPTLTSLFPKTYKNHTAYYWFRNVNSGVDARKLNIKKGMAVTEVVTLLAGIVGAVATCGWSIVAAVAATSVITAGGATIANGLVSLTISPTIGVIATNYESKFLDASGNSTGATFKGSKITVKTEGSRYYNQVFYEDYCPQISQKFGLTAFLNTFKGDYIKYPGLSYYTEL